MNRATLMRSKTAGLSSQPPPAIGTIVTVSLVVGSIAALAVTMEATSYDIWGAFWIGPMLLIATIPLARHAARIESSVRAGRLIILAAFTKVIGGSVARYIVDFGVYEGSDANGYHNQGAVLAPLLRHGTYGEFGEVTATRFTGILTGHVYAATGPSKLGGFMVFSWLAFIGIYLFWRAFRMAFPEGDHRRYGVLVFFFPTILLWTSGTGKDAWMMLCLGAATWGFAALLNGRIIGVPVMAVALLGAGAVRPHLVLILLVAAIAALPVGLLRRQSAGSSGGVLAQLLLVTVVGLAAVVTVGQATAFFKLEDLNAESADVVTERVESLTGRSGSTFEPADPRSPIGYPIAAVTVLFRPLPFEASNLQNLLASAEGILVLGLVLASLPRLRRLPGMVLRVPYLMFALTYTLTFIFAFASIANFGILARQRAQLLPLLFILFCIHRNESPPLTVDVTPAHEHLSGPSP